MQASESELEEKLKEIMDAIEISNSTIARLASQSFCIFTIEGHSELESLDPWLTVAVTNFSLEEDERALSEHHSDVMDRIRKTNEEVHHHTSICYILSIHISYLVR